MKQKQLIIAIIAAVIIVNGVGFLFFMKGKSSAQPPPPIATTAPTATVNQEEVERTQNARARRAAGVAALEAGDYEKALINFTEAQALIGENAKVAELLKITEDLRTRAAQKKADDTKEPEVAKSVPVPVAPRPGASPPPSRPTRTAPTPVAAARPPEKVEPRPTEAPAPISTGTGMLLVSTTPRGLLVQVDGTAMDLTPMRAPVKVGAHKIGLFDGDRRVYETSVEVYEGQVATVLKDLSVELAPKVAAVETRTETRPEPTPPEPKPARTARTEPPPAAVPAPTAAPAPVVPAPAAPSTGGLVLTSPGLYGEIWVNGRPQGFPPVTVNNLAVGSVKVEVRVNGAVKRSSTVAVEAGLVKPVKIVK